MIEIDIPGYKHLKIAHVVFDVNGTVAVDGELIEGVAPLIRLLRQQVDVHLLTADTHGKQKTIDRQLALTAHIVQRGAVEKADYVAQLGAETVVAIGNGAIDSLMCEVAALGIAVIGGEGVASMLLSRVDVVVIDICDALNLLLHPNRLRATLRR
jgi:soluble P-type ATPase